MSFQEGTAVSSTAVYNYWKDFDLETFRGNLDQKGLTIAENQESSLKSRKQLAEKTKEYRKNLGQDIFKQIAPLLKAYQEEVDALTSRAKLGESAFLDIFKKLYEAPDPAPAISSGLELASRSADLEAQMTKMAAELSEYKAESKELKNQDLTIRRLEERIRILEAEVAEKDALIEETEAAVAAEMEARTMDEARQREEQLEAELSRAEAALEAMRRMHQATQSQLFSMQEKGEEAAAASRAEAQYAASEIERAEERMRELTRERDDLLKMVKERENTGDNENGDDDTSNNDGVDNDNDDDDTTTTITKTSRTTTNATTMNNNKNARMNALQEELKTQRELVRKLQDELSFYEQRKESERLSAEERIINLQKSLKATEAHAAALEAELAGRPTRDELEEARGQIRVLNALVHNVVDDDDEGGDNGNGDWGDDDDNGGDSDDNNKTTSTSTTTTTRRNTKNTTTMNNKSTTMNNKSTTMTTTTNNNNKSLESALIAKNRHLEHKLTMARLEATEAQAAVDAATTQLTEVRNELEKHKELVAKLEEDLRVISSSGGGINNENSNTAAADQQSPLSPTAYGSGSIITTINDAGIDGSSSGGIANEQTMLSVLSAQRDRLRDRIQQLESDAVTAQHALSKAKMDYDALKADNMALIERLRYLQTYGSNNTIATTTAHSSSSKQHHSSAFDIEGGTMNATSTAMNDSNVVKRYMKEYENQMNPLNDFRAREQEARRRQMPLQDRAAYFVGSALVSGNKIARSAIVVYAMLLHIIAFVVLAGFSHRHVDKMDALEEMCAQMHNNNTSVLGMTTTTSGGGVTDPVLGGLG